MKVIMNNIPIYKAGELDVSDTFIYNNKVYFVCSIYNDEVIVANLSEGSTGVFGKDELVEKVDCELHVLPRRTT